MKRCAALLLCLMLSLTTAQATILPSTGVDESF